MAQLGEGESDCSETRSGDDSSRCKATKVAHSQDAAVRAQRLNVPVVVFCGSHPSTFLSGRVPVVS